MSSAIFQANTISLTLRLMVYLITKCNTAAAVLSDTSTNLFHPNISRHPLILLILERSNENQSIKFNLKRQLFL